jgi:hypothetical protein
VVRNTDGCFILNRFLSFPDDNPFPATSQRLILSGRVEQDDFRVHLFSYAKFKDASEGSTLATTQVSPFPHVGRYQMA